MSQTIIGTLRRFKRAREKNQKLQEKRKSREKSRNNLFTLDPLEDRILLSADPITHEIKNIVDTHETIVVEIAPESDKQEESKIVDNTDESIEAIYDDSKDINLDVSQLGENSIVKVSDKEKKVQDEEAKNENLINEELPEDKELKEEVLTNEELPSDEEKDEIILEIDKDQDTKLNELDETVQNSSTDYTLELIEDEVVLENETTKELVSDDVELVSLLNDEYFNSADDATAPPALNTLENSEIGHYSEERGGFIVDTNYLEENDIIEDGTELVIGEDMILGGTGTLNVDLVNNNLLSPGYSPGKLVVDGNYEQGSDATLLIELAGTEKATAEESVSQPDKYDNIEVTGNVSLDGTLNVVFWNEDADKFENNIEVGDTFEIIVNSGDKDGHFSNITGLYGFKDDYYFDIQESANSFTLVTKELVAGDNLSFDNLKLTDTTKNDIGSLLNYEYFVSHGIEEASLPKEVTITNTDLNISDSLKVTGEFVLKREDAKDITLNDDENTKVNTNVITISTKDATVIYGTDVNSTENRGLSLVGVDMGLALFSSSDESDDKSWLVSEANIDSASILNLEDVSLTADNLTWDINLGFGENNATAVDLSSEADKIVFGDITLDNSAESGQILQIAGNATLKVSEFDINGDFWFSKSDSLIEIAGSNISSTMTIEGVTVGAEDANFGLISSASGIAFQSKGEVKLEGGGFTLPSAEATEVRFNTTGVAYSNHEILIGDHSYIFDTLEASTTLSEVSVSGLQANIDNVFDVSGDFGFKKNGNDLNIIAQNSSVLLGSSDYGVGVENASLGMVINSSGKALEAIGGVYVNLGETVSISADSAKVLWNSTGTSFKDTTINTAGLSYTFGSLESENIKKVEMNNAKLNLSNFVYASGDFSFESSKQDLNVVDSDNNSTKTNLDILMLGASNVTIFAGTNGDLDSRVGVEITNANFGLALINDTQENQSWSSLKSESGTVLLIGADDITLSSSNLNIELNTSSQNNSIIDYASTSLDISTGIGSKVTLDMDGTKGELYKVAGEMNLSVSDFFVTSGNFALEKTTDIVTLDDGSSVNVDLLTLGASGVDAFIGVDGSTDDKMGLEAKDINFALALITNQDKTLTENWTSLQATIDTASFQGIDNITLDASDFNIEINRSSSDRFVDYLSNNLVVQTGVNDNIIFRMDGTQKELTRASGDLDINIDNFFSTSGSFAIEKKTESIKLSDGSDIDVNILTIGASNIDAFVGINGNSDDKLGLEVKKVDFALVLASNKANTDKYTTDVTIIKNQNFIKMLEYQATINSPTFE